MKARRAVGNVDSSFDSDRYCNQRLARSGIATASNPTVSACLRKDFLNLCIPLTLQPKYTLTNLVDRRSVSLVLQMIYKFYWFLPAHEDIYQDLSETPNWPGSLKRKRHLDPTPESALVFIICSHATHTAIFIWRRTLMPNEARDRLSNDQSIIFQSEQAGAPALPGEPALPGPQPRPALTLVNGNREISYENYECFIGVSPNVHDLKKFIGVHASQTHPVLLIGERGLRQEQIARVLHQPSAQWAQPFFAVNAHGLSAEALHNILFGPQGMIETVKQGTIYINELTSLPQILQQRFAVYLEEQRWRGREGRQRLVFASEWNPADRKAENRIAYGLVEMLRQFSFTIKPLRERSEDIPYIARHMLSRIAQKTGKGAHGITAEALAAVTEYNWEGNLDELESVLESAISFLPPQQIDESVLPSRIRYAHLKSIPPDGIDLPQIVDDFERGLIATALDQSDGSQTKASKLLGLRVQTLNMKLKRYADQQRPLL